MICFSFEYALLSIQCFRVETISRILPIPDYPVENSSRITYPIILEEQKPRIVKSQFPTPQSFSSVSKNRLKSVLVVCGTDGSGTRRVVQILTELGVTMVSEDPETYDIHADIVGGWPPIVSPVLAAARSLNYDPDRLPKELSITISRSLKSLLGHFLLNEATSLIPYTLFAYCRFSKEGFEKAAI